MEKLFYMLWCPEPEPRAAWAARLADLPHAVAQAGGRFARLGVPDVPVPHDDPYPDMRRTAPAGFISFWLPSAHARAGAEAAVRQAAARIAGYVVAESTALPGETLAEGIRAEGFLQVCGFAALPGLSRADLWQHWLGHHTAVALETQSTTFYNQNIVVRALTAAAPAWDAIVEERFPDAALNRRDVYFDAVGDPAKQASNAARMAESCARFIDFSTITLMNCGEFRYG